MQDRRPGRVLATLLTALAALIAGPARSVVSAACPGGGLPIYVSVSGDDEENDGLDPTTPLRTITEATRWAFPGDTIVVGPGRYDEGSLKPARNWATPDCPITFLADPSGESTGEPPGPVIVDAGTDHVAAFFISSRPYVTINGFTVTGGRAAGIYVLGNSPGVKVVNNEVSHTGDKGIMVKDAPGVLIFNNLVHDNPKVGILVETKEADLSAEGAVIVNNTVVNNGVRGISIGSNTHYGSPGATVLNNITVGHMRGIDVDDNSLPGYFGDFNLVADGYATGTPRGLFDLVTDPMFVDPAAGDYHLVPARPNEPGSPAVDAGSGSSENLGLDQASTDPDGLPDRYTVDLGYHYGNRSDGPRDLTIQSAVMYYVRTSGRDSNSGRSPTLAFASISKAAKVAQPGDIVVVGPGVYREGNIKPRRSGTADAPITFLADPTGRRTDDPPGPVVVNAHDLRHGFRITRRSYITVDGFEVRKAHRAGIFVGPGTGNIVRNCIVHTSGLGIQVYDAPYTTVFNNLVYRNRNSGIHLGGKRVGSSNSTIVNNTVYRNRNRGIRVGSRRQASTGVVVMGNIINRSRRQGIQVYPNSLEGYVGDYNLNTDGYGKSTPPGPHDIVARPLFMSVAGPDGKLGGRHAADDNFRLMQAEAGDALTSPAVDAGADSAAAFGLSGRTTRSDGEPDRGTVDLGFHYAE